MASPSQDERVDLANALLARLEAHPPHGAGLDLFKGARFFWGAGARRRIGQVRRTLRFGDGTTAGSFGLRGLTANWPKTPKGYKLRPIAWGVLWSVFCFVRTGEPIDPLLFGPWGEGVAGGDAWGYGNEAMEVVRATLVGHPAIARKHWNKGATKP